MVNQITKNITIPKALVRKKQGTAILPLEGYERMKEDLEMFQSKKLVRDIEKARKEKRSVPLEKLLKEHNL